jgi:protease-4
MLMEDLSGAKVQWGHSLIKKEIGEEAYGILQELKNSTQQKGVQARLPFTITIK